LNEKGIVHSSKSADLKKGDTVIAIDPQYFRPAEVDDLMADASKAREKLNWKPRVTFEQLVKIMINADMELAGIVPLGEGQKILHDNDIRWIRNSHSIGG
jgi:GDPmannose 4,6-dehydratase